MKKELNKLVCLYRISDSGNPAKVKIGYLDKLQCLDNFTSIFRNERIVVFADNCSDYTLAEIKERNLELVETLGLGNAKSWRFSAEWAFKNLNKEDIIYFVEDDYYHLPIAPEKIKEIINIGDYISLYDHPDKYNINNRKGNPYNKSLGEVTQVFIQNSYYWKITNSTTMTFACKVRTIFEDKFIWWFCTKKKVPNDFLAFQLLTKQPMLYNFRYKKNLFYQILFIFYFRKRRLLINPLPSISTHIEIDWIPFNIKKIIDLKK